jgi:hypothetical protein
MSWRAFVGVLALCAGFAHADNPPTVIVGGEKGLAEVTLGGTVIRTFITHAIYAARRDGQTVYYLTNDHREVHALSLSTGTDKKVATLPKQVVSCGGEHHPKGVAIRLAELSVPSEHDFVIEGGKIACLTLQDRNDNMADVQVNVRIDLATGRTEHSLDLPACGYGVRDCAPRPSAETGVSEGTFDLVDGAIVKRGPPEQVLRTLGSGDFSPSGVSPSGKWLLMRGNGEENDLIYSDLLLLDRQNGDVWTVSAKPHKLTKRELSTIGNRKSGTTVVVGETTIYWLPKRDLLVIDDTLVTPMVGSVQLPGQILR